LVGLKAHVTLRIMSFRAYAGNDRAADLDPANHASRALSRRRRLLNGLCLLGEQNKV